MYRRSAMLQNPKLQTPQSWSRLVLNSTEILPGINLQRLQVAQSEIRSVAEQGTRGSRTEAPATPSCHRHRAKSDVKSASRVKKQTAANCWWREGTGEG